MKCYSNEEITKLSFISVSPDALEPYSSAQTKIHLYLGPILRYCQLLRILQSVKALHHKILSKTEAKTYIALKIRRSLLSEKIDIFCAKSTKMGPMVSLARHTSQRHVFKMNFDTSFLHFISIFYSKAKIYLLKESIKTHLYSTYQSTKEDSFIVLAVVRVVVITTTP